MINQRIFSANVGDSSVGNAGPDAIEQDIDNLLANDQELLGTLNDHETQKATQNGYGHIRLSDIPESGGKRTARFTVGTSTAGWTAADCDYLCDGTADQTEINAAITALPATGGEVVILDGTYNITVKINVAKNNVSIRGNGNATILKRMYNSSTGEGVITLTSRSGCKIANLQVDGNKASYTASNNFGIYLSSSSNNTVTGNTCNNNNNDGIRLYSSSNNTVTGNTCIRGTGQTSDYTSSQYTIQLGTTSNYNLISSNNCMGKAVVIGGGTGNSVWGNKFDNTNDLP